MKTMTIRSVDPELDRIIKSKASKENLSVNHWVVKTLRHATGTDKKPLFKKHDDLDSLAGGWNDKETESFLKSISIFEEIDEEIWK